MENMLPELYWDQNLMDKYSNMYFNTSIYLNYQNYHKLDNYLPNLCMLHRETSISHKHY